MQPATRTYQADFDALKRAALSSLRVMYPHGMDTATQHRDLIRLYITAWNTCLHALGVKTLTQEYVGQCKRVADPNWWPDESWAWWTGGRIELG